MIANGIFSSKLIYQISLWGGTDDYLLKALQIIQNKAARFVTKSDFRTPVLELLNQCGWLRIRQLVFYHSTIQIYKTIQTTYPKYIYYKLANEFPYNTRLAQSEAVRMGPDFKAKLEITKGSFMNRATVNYNQLPESLRKIPKIGTFKKKLKIWVIENVSF